MSIHKLVMRSPKVRDLSGRKPECSLGWITIGVISCSDRPSLNAVVVNHNDLFKERVRPFLTCFQCWGSQSNLVPVLGLKGNRFATSVFLSFIGEPILNLLVGTEVGGYMTVRNGWQEHWFSHWHLPVNYDCNEDHPGFTGIHRNLVIDHSKNQ